MTSDKWHLYYLMYCSRLFEKTVLSLWTDGIILGEMHLGMGEEAIAAGFVTQLKDGDAMALDHRGTPPLLMRGCDPVKLLLELLGNSNGICAGMGGHMHLFSKDYLSVSSGIVGASGPAAAGFALAMQYRKSDHVAVCFFGEGALNQGMMMESLNLAAVWKLPVIFICKDNNMAITTRSSQLTAGTPCRRAESFGIPADEIDGSDIEVVWPCAEKAVTYARKGNGPYFVHAHCVHHEGHFLGDPLLRQVRHPIKETFQKISPLLKSIAQRKGATISQRKSSLANVSSLLVSTLKSQFSKKNDPLYIMRQRLTNDKSELAAIEKKAENEMQRILQESLIIHKK